MTVYFQATQDIQISTRVSRAQYQYTLVGTDAAEVLEWADKLARQLRGDPALREVASEAQEGGPRVQVDVDREQAGRLGVSMQSITDTLNDAFGQRQISTIYGQANQYRVILEAQPRYQQDPGSLAQALRHRRQHLDRHGGDRRQYRDRQHQHQHHGHAQHGDRLEPGAARRLRALREHLGAARDRAPGAVPLGHHQLRSGARLRAVRRGRASSARRSSEIGMPSSVTGSYSGDAAEFAKSLAGEPWLILAAAIVIYIVLGVLYESFIHPLTILSTLPSAGVGALLALMLFGYDLSVIALIGIVLLMGIVKKNAILMIDFALEAERHQGLSPRGIDRAGGAAALPPDHDDDAGRAVRRAAAGARKRHRLGAAQSARHHHRRRPAAQPVAHALHHAGDLSLHGAAARAADRARDAGRAGGVAHEPEVAAVGPDMRRNER